MERNNHWRILCHEHNTNIIKGSKSGVCMQTDIFLKQVYLNPNTTYNTGFVVFQPCLNTIYNAE